MPAATGISGTHVVVATEFAGSLKQMLRPARLLLAVTAQSILYSPPGARQNLAGSNASPNVQLLDPLPGVANSFTGSEPSKWVTGIPSHGTVRIAEVYPVAVEFAGAAPGLLAGVTQINIKLPDAIPDTAGYPRGVVPLSVTTPGMSYYPATVTIAASPD